MEARGHVLRETLYMTLGELAGTALTVAVFWALGYFQMNVLWGALAGALVTVGNFFFMAVTVDLAADRAQRGDVKQAQSMVRLSSTVRLVVMGLVLFLCIKLGANVVALLVPLLLERPIVMLCEFFRKKVD